MQGKGVREVSSRTLADWLDYQQRTHPRSIELGLDRVREVWRRLGTPAPAPVVITVGGTNGKGSTVAFLEAMLATMGRRVGCYTSPHLLRYNERIRVAGADADDALLIDAFARIEAARGADSTNPVALTYFEFGTLAALWIFAQSGLDAAVLEVGLGGRLDAVNIVDADAAIVVTVDLDHQDWLGNDVDVIGREKAGIFRKDRPAIVGMREPPRGLLDEAARIGARIVRAGHDFRISPQIDSWRWDCGGESLLLPQPDLAAPCQIDNAAAAIMALHALRDRIGRDAAAIARGVRAARVTARLQRLHKNDAGELVIDVGHNPQAARVLAQWLAAHPPRGRNLAVFGALADKDVAGIVEPLLPHIAQWHLCGLDADSPRGLSATHLRERMPPAKSDAHASAAVALDAAALRAGAEDRLLAFGSFFVAAPALEWAQRTGYG
ncbi:MAG: bifunctional tetrahydrofolate synthase/dihydrofolate synthase [Xanthomonadaceae bacterium]|nr:bifunctional tetrahydrofolate synthase/dihydrofolate synthase [Xanthomonadaceae bacterium]